jgi:phosphonate transport system substrate-binding protein
MQLPSEKSSLFSGVILLLVAAIVGTTGMLWYSFIDFRVPQSTHEEVFSTVASGSAFIGTPGAAEFSTVRIGFDLPRGEVVGFIEAVLPRVRAMAEKVGLPPVEIVVANDQRALPSMLARGEVHLAALSSTLFAEQARPNQLVPLLIRASDKPKQTLFIVAVPSRYQALGDLAGRTLAYKDPDSTSGYLVPIRELKRQNIDPATFFGKEVFSGNLQNSIMGLRSGEYDCAAISSIFFDEMPEEARAKFRIIHASPPIPGGVYATAATLPASVAASISRMLLDGSRDLPADVPYAGWLRVQTPPDNLLLTLEEEIANGPHE